MLGSKTHVPTLNTISAYANFNAEVTYQQFAAYKNYMVERERVGKRLRNGTYRVVTKGIIIASNGMMLICTATMEHKQDTVTYRIQNEPLYVCYPEDT